VIAEGDRACDWLADQGYALWRTDPSRTYRGKFDRYQALTAGRPLAWTGAPSREAVTRAAWGHLCPASLQLRRPYYVFNDRPGD